MAEPDEDDFLDETGGGVEFGDEVVVEDGPEGGVGVEFFELGATRIITTITASPISPYINAFFMLLLYHFERMLFF